jgi:hypothetical protein
MRNCVSHHFACQCRENKWQDLQVAISALDLLYLRILSTTKTKVPRSFRDELARLRLKANCKDESTEKEE